MKFELTQQTLAVPAASSSRLDRSADDRRNIIRCVGDLGGRLNDEPLVCLTFDDGPDPVYTPLILDILREYRVSASFFVTGEAALYIPWVVGRIIDDGHSIGNHSYNHSHPWLGSSGYARQEVSRASQVIAHIAGKPLRWFRPPFGRLRQAMIAQAAAENMTTVLWSHSIIDWGWCATDAGIGRRLNNIKAGDIVLMHDGKRQSNRPEILVRQLPALLERLKQKMVLATLDQVAR